MQHQAIDPARRRSYGMEAVNLSYAASPIALMQALLGERTKTVRVAMGQLC